MRDGPPSLDTPRLRLRPVEPADAGATAALVTPDVTANLSTWPSPMTEAQARARILESRRLEHSREAINFAILDRAQGELLGWIGLIRMGERTARLGYWLGSAHRGRGLMKEAAAAALPAAAAFLEVTDVVALALPGNRPSIAVLDSLGFRPAGAEEFFFEIAGKSWTCLKFLWSPSQKGLPSPLRAD
jgi:RimJ/RimL family protein N-acetyltransferase